MCVSVLLVVSRLLVSILSLYGCCCCCCYCCCIPKNAFSTGFRLATTTTTTTPRRTRPQQVQRRLASFVSSTHLGLCSRGRSSLYTTTTTTTARSSSQLFSSSAKAAPTSSAASSSTTSTSSKSSSSSSALSWILSAATTPTGSSTGSNNNSNNYVMKNDVSMNNIGEADRAFMMGMRLDKNGQARAASASFHEAATLYQCVLDSPSEFGHVTALDASTTDNECRNLLSYTCLRLAHLNHDALGDAKAAVRLYKLAIEMDQPHTPPLSYDGLGTSWEASFPDQLSQALQAYQQATSSTGTSTTTSSTHTVHHPDMVFHMAVALDRMGQVEKAQELLEQLRRLEAQYACWVDSWGYVRWHTRKVPTSQLNLYLGTRDMLQIALEAAMPLIMQPQQPRNRQNNDNDENDHGNYGWVCEFGVASGRSLRMTQELLPLDVPIHGFDTFTGLPQAWGTEPKGAYSTGGILPNMEGKVYFHKGLFRDTIPVFIEQEQQQRLMTSAIGDDGNTMVLAYANIDCDLYSSTLEVLEAMHGRIVPGTILVFDEYMGHPTWRQDEFRAWRECCKRFGWQYEYLAFSLFTKQAIVRVTDA